MTHHVLHRQSHTARAYRPVGRLHLATLCLSGGALALSATAWLIAHYFARSDAPEGLPHPLEPWAMRVHGAAAMLFLIAFGAMLPIHATSGWQRRANRASGITAIALVALLTLTGYFLYYAAGDEWRAASSLLHWTAGIVAVVALIGHAVVGRRQWRPTALERR